jgi:hypothetical protein
MRDLSSMTLWLAAFGAVLLLDSCQWQGGFEGLPRNLPKVALNGSRNTPPHGLAKSDYPFDAQGNYIEQWVSESASPGGNYDSWRSSHGGSVSSRRPSSRSSVLSGSGYVIKKGDTLGAIAKRHGVSVSRLKAANGLKSDFIREGRRLIIPKR